MRKKDGDDNRNNMKDTSGYEESGVRLAWFGLKDVVSVLLPTGSGLVPAVLEMVNWIADEYLYVPVS